MTRPDPAIHAYLEGQLTHEQARAIDTWIAADAGNAASFLHLIRTHQTLGLLGKEDKLAREAALVQPHTIDHVTLASLAKMEAAAETIDLDELDPPFAFEPKDYSKNKKDITLPQALDDLRWAAGKVAGRIIRSTPFITGTIAAVLLLGVYLFVPFGNSDEPTGPDAFTDNTQPKPAASTQPTPRGSDAVATLTATHNATWAERALARGSDLHAGTRLTLTAGFAEITTHDGAIAILEAPATIELTDNDNALRLHAGKLVGICETESSQGFLVYTPHMLITDLGTRFGVEARDHSSRTHVMEGLVEVRQGSTATDTNPIRVSARQSAQANDRSLGLVAFDAELDQYDAADSVLASGVRVTGDAMFSAVMPADLRVGANEAEYAFVYREKTGIMLDQPLKVTLTQPGQYSAVADLASMLSTTASLTSYLVHFDNDSEISEVPQRCVAVLEFDRPIVGVIANSEQLTQTNALLGRSGVWYSEGAVSHGLENGVKGRFAADRVLISDDRRTLTVDIQTLSNALDQLRVLVQTSD